MNIFNRIREDKGFSGSTHALSAIGIYLLITVFLSDFIFSTVIGTKDLFFYILSVCVVVGMSLLPDIDNTKSLVISNLGSFGKLLSKLFRSLSTVIYSITKTKYDNDEHNAHRGFWHTLLSVFLVGGCIFGLTVIDYKIPLFNKEYSIGFFFSILFLFISIRFAISGLFAIFNKKQKKSFVSGLISFVFVLILSVFAVLMKPENLHNYWIGYLASIGYFIHLLGDLNTPMGIPFIFPFKIRGKRWFYIRLLKIESGGTIEKFVIRPIFFLMIVFSVFKLIPIIGGVYVT